jgi:hypothetical protein
MKKKKGSQRPTHPNSRPRPTDASNGFLLCALFLKPSDTLEKWAWSRHDLNIIRKAEKIEQSKTVEVLLVWRGTTHGMDGRLEVAIGNHRQGIASL